MEMIAFIGIVLQGCVEFPISNKDNTCLQSGKLTFLYISSLNVSVLISIKPCEDGGPESVLPILQMSKLRLHGLSYLPELTWQNETSVELTRDSKHLSWCSLARATFLPDFYNIAYICIDMKISWIQLISAVLTLEA